MKGRASQGTSNAAQRTCLFIVDAQNDFVVGPLGSVSGMNTANGIAGFLQCVRGIRRVKKQKRPFCLEFPAHQVEYSGVNQMRQEMNDFTTEGGELLGKNTITSSVNKSGDAERLTGSNEENGSDSLHAESELHLDCRNEWCYMTIFSQDWHPASHVSFVSSHAPSCIHSICSCKSRDSSYTNPVAVSTVSQATMRLGLKVPWTVVPCSVSGSLGDVQSTYVVDSKKQKRDYSLKQVLGLHPMLSIQPTAQPNADIVSLWPPHCIAGTEGAKIYSALRIEPGDFIVRKGQHEMVRRPASPLQFIYLLRRDWASDVFNTCTSCACNLQLECLSACGDGCQDTGVKYLLHSAGITRVALCGFCLDYCVGATAVSLANIPGVKEVTLLTDLCCWTAGADSVREFSRLRAAGIRCEVSSDFLERVAA